MTRRLAIAIGFVCAVLPTAAQAPERMATTADALIANGGFFDGKTVVIRHAVREADRLTLLDATSKPVYILWKDKGAGTDGEIRGEFRDLGRILAGDSRLSSYDFQPIVDAASNGRWPGRDQVYVILGATFVEGPAPSAPTIRGIALMPEQFDGKQVTVVGRFRGRNLYGDAPRGVAKSKWDFILQSADGAVWITGLRPKGKDFDLNPEARVDTGRWLEVKGTVQREGTSVWIAAESLHLASAPAEVPVEIRAPAAPREPPPTVIFSAPLSDETDFPVDGRVRIQFSRDMTAGSFRGHVRIRYTAANAPASEPPQFSLVYNDGTRSLEIRFQQPLGRFQPVLVQLDDGITAIDGQPLQPYALRFTTGQ